MTKQISGYLGLGRQGGTGGPDYQEEAFGAMETFILIAIMASQVYVCDSH